MADEKDILKIENGVLKRCKEDAVNVLVPEGVTEIDGRAFEFCESLSSVVIGEGVTKIGWYAFENCKSLKSIVIPSTVTEICNNAFRGCKAVETVVSASASFPFNEKTSKLYDATKKSKKLILVASASKEMAKKAKIKQVKKASASAVLDSILSEHQAVTDVIRNEEDAYLRVKASDSGIDIILPDSKVRKWMHTLPGLLDLATTGADAGALRKYAADSSLEDTSCKYISVSKDGSVKLKKNAEPVHLVIPEGVTEIGEMAFEDCETLTSVVIPWSVTKIGWWAFRDCKSLPSVVIPATVTEIGGYAFNGCKSLTSLEFGGTMAQWEAIDRGYEWNDGVPAKTVKCTDGEAKI